MGGGLSARGALAAALTALVAGLLTIPADISISALIGERAILPQFGFSEWILRGFFLGALIGPVLLVADATRPWRRAWARLLVLLLVACVLDRLLYLQGVVGWGVPSEPLGFQVRSELGETLRGYLHSPILSFAWELPIGFALTLACWQRRWRSIPLAGRILLCAAATFGVGLLALTGIHLDLQGLEPGSWHSSPWWEGISYNWGAAHALSGVWLAALLPGLLALGERVLPRSEGEEHPAPSQVSA